MIWQGTLPENAKEDGFMADGEAARASGGDNGCPPFIFAFLPIFWEQDLKGAGRTMVDGPNYRWQFLVSYPEGHKEDGDQWMMNEILPAFAAMPEVTRMMTSKVKKRSTTVIWIVVWRCGLTVRKSGITVPLKMLHLSKNRNGLSMITSLICARNSSLQACF